MIIKNAVNKLEKYGKVKYFEEINEYSCIYKGYIISFHPNGDNEPDIDAVCFHTCKIGQIANSQSDYFPGSFWRNLTQAINFVEEYGD